MKRRLTVVPSVKNGLSRGLLSRRRRIGIFTAGGGLACGLNVSDETEPETKAIRAVAKSL
jgi:hypothetical protein